MFSCIARAQKVGKFKLKFQIVLLKNCQTQCGLRGSKNRACSIYWLEDVKGVPNHGVVCFVSLSSFFCSLLYVYIVFCSFVFGCQYQCNQLPGKTCLQLCVKWDVKPSVTEDLLILCILKAIVYCLDILCLEVLNSGSQTIVMKVLHLHGSATCCHTLKQPK